MFIVQGQKKKQYQQIKNWTIKDPYLPWPLQSEEKASSCVMICLKTISLLSLLLTFIIYRLYENI